MDCVHDIICISSLMTDTHTQLYNAVLHYKLESNCPLLHAASQAPNISC